MATKVEDVKVLNIDDVPYAVDAMSDEVRAMVDTFNDWNRREAGIVDDLALVRAAKNNLSMSIIQQVRKEKQEAEEAASAATEEVSTTETVDESVEV